MDDDVGRADDVETGTVGASDAAKRDGLRAEIHDAADLPDPLRRDRGPVGDKERTENRDGVGAAQRNVCPTRRPIESPVGGVACGELVGGADERKTIRRETDIVHQITSVGGEARKIRQGKSDGRAARHGCAGHRELGTGKASRSDTRKPTVRHYKAQIGNRARATAGEQHGLSLEARAIQKRLRFGRRRTHRQRKPQSANEKPKPSENTRDARYAGAIGGFGGQRTIGSCRGYHRVF